VWNSFLKTGEALGFGCGNRKYIRTIYLCLKFKLLLALVIERPQLPWFPRTPERLLDTPRWVYVMAFVAALVITLAIGAGFYAIVKGLLG
jgi:hypothetical protein